MEKREIEPIAVIHNDFKEKFGIPRQSGRCPSMLSEIEMIGEYDKAEAFREIEGFSHLWLLFEFDKAKQNKFSPTVRPPRLGGNKRVGVFASRSPYRPNGIGLTVVKLVGVEKEKHVKLTVSGADILDGTYIFDIKPYIPSADSVSGAIGGYSENFTNYKLQVLIDENLKEKIPPNKLPALIECLEDDPRPSYQEDGVEYGMKFGELNIRFTVKDKTLTVIDVN